MIKKLPKSFFEKDRPRVEKESRQDITPFVWPKEILDGKKRVVFSTPKKVK